MRRATRTHSGDSSTPVTRCPFLASSSAIWPGPEPTSSMRDPGGIWASAKRKPSPTMESMYSGRRQGVLENQSHGCARLRSGTWPWAMRSRICRSKAAASPFKRLVFIETLLLPLLYARLPRVYRRGWADRRAHKHRGSPAWVPARAGIRLGRCKRARHARRAGLAPPPKGRGFPGNSDGWRNCSSAGSLSGAGPGVAVLPQIVKQALGLEHGLRGHGGLQIGVGGGQIQGGLGRVRILLVAELLLHFDERLAGRVAGGGEVVLGRAVETAFIVQMRRGGLYVRHGRQDAGAVIALQRGQQAANCSKDVIGRRVAGPSAAAHLAVEDLLGSQSDGDLQAVGILDLSGRAGLSHLQDRVAVGCHGVLRLPAQVAAEDILAVYRGLAQADQLLQDALH